MFLANPSHIGTGNEARGGQPAPTVGAENDVLPAAHTGMPALASIRVHSLGMEMPRSHSTMTVMSRVTAGASSLSSSTVGSIQEPRQVARWMRQDTGMAQLR